MTRVRWAVAAAVGLLAANGGCVSCDARNARATWEAGPACEVPVCDRRHVYAVLVNGAVPAGGGSLEPLRDGLAARGFPKTYYGQAAYAPWLGWEMRAVAGCDPAARFVLVGVDVGAPVAALLARQAAAAGLNVDTLVLIEPTTIGSLNGGPVRTVVVTHSADCPATDGSRVIVPGTTRLTLPGHASTVECVRGLLAESAAKVEHPPAVFDLPPDDARPPRDLTAPPGAAGEWLFLNDAPGFSPPPLSPVPPGPPLPGFVPPAYGAPRLGSPSGAGVGPIAPSLVPRDGYPPPADLPRPQLPPAGWGRWPTPAPTPPAAQPLPAPRNLGPSP